MRARADFVLRAQARSQDWLRGCGGGACVLRGLVRCQRALSATLFPDKAVVKGLTPAGHGCWGGESSSSTPDLLACRRRLSQPPSPLLRLADTLHHHPQGRPFLTLSQHLHSCLSTHTHTKQTTFHGELKKKETSRNWRHSLVSLETGYYRVRKKH